MVLLSYASRKHYTSELRVKGGIQEGEDGIFLGMYQSARQPSLAATPRATSRVLPLRPLFVPASSI